ncbi:ABC transporter permease, partial [Salinibacterium sp.]|uniref:ABC transporter permease n=1 Tax=Salinibacterium sp. TaxID=1915057 RepID=UPI00286D33D6
MTTQDYTRRPGIGESVGRLVRHREVPVSVALIALVAITYVANPRFLSSQSIKDLLLNATIVMILATGQALVLITRNVDLSVGSVLGLSGFLTGTLFATFPGIPIPVVFLAGITIGLILGAVNGLLVTSAGVPALVITLGTLYIYRGINNAWAGGKEYFSGDRPVAFGNLSVDTVVGFPIISLIALSVLIVIAVILAATRAGRDFYAIGSDPAAAKLFGIPIKRRVFTAFVLN